MSSPKIYLDTKTVKEYAERVMSPKRKTSIALPAEIDKALELAAARLGIGKGEAIERATRLVYAGDVTTARRALRAEGPR
jgi:hypothetical protein